MPTDLQTILKLEVPVVVQIGSRTMCAADILALNPGAIIELGKQVEDELEIIVNNKAIGMGRAVKVGENFGIRVSYIGDQKERVNAIADTGDTDEAPAGEEADVIPAVAEQLTQ